MRRCLDGGKKWQPGHESYKWSSPPRQVATHLLILVGLSVVFLLIVALLGAAKAGGSLFSESNLLVCSVDLLRGRRRALYGFRGHRDLALRAVRLCRDWDRSGREYAGGCAPLVSIGTSAVRQHLRDAAELCLDGRSADA